MKYRLKSLAAACALSLLAGSALAQTLKPLNSDTETDRMSWSELQSKLGDVPKASAGTKIGGVSKTLTNEYWRALGEGYAAYAKRQASALSIRLPRARATSSASSRSPRT